MSFKPMFGEGSIKARGDSASPLRSASWINSSIILDNRRWECREAELRWTAPHHLVVLTEAGHTSQTYVRSDGKDVYDGRDRSGDITFVPAGVEREGVYRDTKLSYSALWIDPGLDLPGCECAGDLRLLVNGRDDVIASLLRALCAETSPGHKPSAAYVEHLTALIMLRLGALNNVRKGKARREPLSRPALARVRDYVHANIGSDISLSELAEVAGMRVDSFARRFKAATGLAPYAFVLEERIRQAEILLGGTDQAIGNVAIRLGFSSQSHFTSTFRRLRGIAPQAYRTNFIPES
ncbi:AraC family transcriptional regulator [Mesorhizobium sp. L-8-10]|uniref:helix-turn-helix domain-containing protein n=1 Tax=Mesorhizobium sp. L-8-10 TaxID=2744523 RepID=UPI0019295C79|nr:AraC family transcriptional regulator [Mesorhizobium sp. L-8-10]BCH34435.1 AraC family transcriptional regulator [Mesorhizobium sp. L-8-10]